MKNIDTSREISIRVNEKFFKLFKYWWTKYCLEQFSIDSNGKIKYKLKRCDKNKEKEYVEAGFSSTEDRELDLKYLAQYGVYNTVMLCYDTKNEKLKCWIKRKGEKNEIITTEVQINKEKWTSFIYIYCKSNDKGNEYAFLFKYSHDNHDKSYIKKIDGKKEEQYGVIENIVNYNNVDFTINIIVENYNRVNEMSIVDVALNEFNINDCSFYEKLRVFMIAASGLDKKPVFDVHVLNDYVFDHKELKKQPDKLKKILEDCMKKKK